MFSRKASFDSWHLLLLEISLFIDQEYSAGPVAPQEIRRCLHQRIHGKIWPLLYFGIKCLPGWPLHAFRMKWLVNSSIPPSKVRRHKSHTTYPLTDLAVGSHGGALAFDAWPILNGADETGSYGRRRGAFVLDEARRETMPVAYSAQSFSTAIHATKPDEAQHVMPHQPPLSPS